jgi:hypothetical protein
VSGALTSVQVRTGNAGGNSELASATAAPQNYVDVLTPRASPATPSSSWTTARPARSTPSSSSSTGTACGSLSPYTTSYKAGLDKAHAAGAIVRGVTLVTKTSGVDYTLNAATGTVSEVVDFGNGATVLASYWTDFVVPATYPLALNGSPDLGDASGKWSGKPLVDGTYTLGIWTSKSLTLNLFGETNSYRSTSDARNVDFLVGSATTIEPYDLIASGSSCFNCHQELAFHGFGRRGFESCVLCHGTSGAEDRPQYVAGNAPETPGLTISFRTMLHKIHMGKDLTDASTYDVVGFGSGSYPNNFGVSNFAELLFPALPGGVQNCNKCHGNEAWHEPAPRAHPTDQDAPIRRWAVVCGACHDSTDAQAHIHVQTDALGNESCGVCHAPGRNEDVVRVHKPY